eukprot:80196_1
MKSDRISITKWSDIDRFRFYSIGTISYTAITMALHPVNVIKIRRQILNNTEILQLTSGHGKMKSMVSLYRGIGIVLFLAIPARGIYIEVLENGRDCISDYLYRFSGKDSSERSQHLIASASGGLAGGLAAMSAQAIVVPMDVISQRQMVMNNANYLESGDALRIFRDIAKKEGIAGLYKGLGLSLFTSLPTGSIWWAAYSGSQNFMRSMIGSRDSEKDWFPSLAVNGIIQVSSGLTAAVFAATLTQPLDVVKTRHQTSNSLQKSSYTNVARELYSMNGAKGFFRGTGPRIMSLGLWGTVLSSAYEILRNVSRKDYDTSYYETDFSDLTRFTRRKSNL